jgi:TM2 domain-containing membrane protein YozV
MRKAIFTSLVLALMVFCSSTVTAADYTANDNLIDQLFANAPETVNASFADLSSNAKQMAAVNEKSAPVAILLDFFLGGLGVHRFYLGTEVMTGVGYILTCGGIFGIVPLVDFVVLIINMEDISPYVNNPKFFMWAK